MTDNRTTKMLPCPFCGSKNVATSYKDTFSGDFRRGVYCADCCGGIYPYYDTETEAIAAWNARATGDMTEEWLLNACNQVTQDYVTQLEQEVDELKDKLEAATLGSGTLTAEQVEKTIHDCSTYASYDGCTYYASGIRLQAIADELNARAERTCRCTTDDSAWCFVCSECGKSFPRNKLHIAHNHGEINYCPNCGRKVVSE